MFSDHQSIVTFVGQAVNPVATSVFAALGANQQPDQLGFFAQHYFPQPLALLTVTPNLNKLGSPKRFQEEDTKETDTPISVDPSLDAQLSEETVGCFLTSFYCFYSRKILQTRLFQQSNQKTCRQT